MAGTTRRSVTKSLGALSGVLLAPGLPMWAFADDLPPVAPAFYLPASKTLLGINENILVRALPQGARSFADLFFSVLSIGTTIEARIDFENTYSGLTGTDQQKADALLKTGTTIRTDATGTLSRLTMLMWLFGVWYGNTEIKNNMGAWTFIHSDYQKDFVVSSRAYKNGWIWRMARAHPMGSSQFRYGSWADEPPPYTDYIHASS